MSAANDDYIGSPGGQHPPSGRQEATSRLLAFLNAQDHTPAPCLRTLDMLDAYHAKNSQASAELIAALTADTSTAEGKLTQSLEIATTALNALAHEFNVTQKPTVEAIRSALTKTPDITPRALAETIGEMRAAVAIFDRHHVAFHVLSEQVTNLASLWTHHHNCLRFIDTHPNHNAPEYKRDLIQTLRQQGFDGAAAMRIANTASVGAQQLYIQQAVSEDLQALRQTIQVTSGDLSDPSSGLAQLVNLATTQLARADAAMQQMVEAATARYQADKGRG